jgi:hypothetical protein
MPPKEFSLVVTVVLSIALSLWSNATLANSASREIVIAGLPSGVALNVRAAPRLRAEVIGKVRNGDRMPADFNSCFDARTGKQLTKPRTSPHVWCEVIIEGDIIGYARAKYLK